MNSLPKTITRQRRGCDLNPGPSAPESSTLTTRRLPSYPLSYVFNIKKLSLMERYRLLCSVFWACALVKFEDTGAVIACSLSSRVIYDTRDEHTASLTLLISVYRPSTAAEC